MEVQSKTVLFGFVAAVGLSNYVFGVFLFESTAVGGGTGTTEYFEPFRAVGGILLIAAVAGWAVSKFHNNRQ